MINKSRLFKFFYCPLFVFILLGCSNEMDENIVENNPDLAEEIMIIESLGFDISEIIENESYYLVEGDIMIQKGVIPSYKTLTRQARWSELISYPNQKTITVGIDNSIPSDNSKNNWRSEILQALELWNPLSNIEMTYTTDSNPDILIRSDNDSLTNYTIASATWPANGKPGNKIYINLDYDNNKVIPSSQKLYNMVHELGHCLGLRHTNWREYNEYNPPGIHIPGTPESDPNSIMNGRTAESHWNGFSTNDKFAIKSLYPAFNAYIIGFPKYLTSSGLGRNTDIRVNCEHSVTNYSWYVSGGTLVSGQGTSSVVVRPGSPVTFSVSVIITTINGERYSVDQSVGQDSSYYLLN